MSGPTLETERLILRPPAREDFEPLAAMMADPEVARFIGGVVPPSTVWRQLCTLAGAWSIEGFSMFSVLEKASGRWIGRIGPWRPAGWPGTEVGWGLAREAWGKGFALEAATASMDYAVDVLGWDGVIHCIDAENVPSARLAGRLGSSRLRQARLPAPFDINIDIWGQSAAEWRARRRGG